MLMNANEMLGGGLPAFIHTSDLEYWGTGSRVLRKYAVEGPTDYDLFVQSSPKAVNELLDHGFLFCKTYSPGTYRDPVLVGVYRLPCARYIPGGSYLPSVHVQIVEHINRKINAQNLLLRIFPYGMPSDKRRVRALWTLAYLCV